MLNRIINTLKERPIVSIIVCVIMSEIIQFVISLFSDKSPSFHYGIAVVALLSFFIIPIFLSIKSDIKKMDSEMKDSADDGTESGDNQSTELSDK